MANLSEEDRATLVAYLDGELDEPATAALEAKLSRDPSLRAEADALKKTWELLDYLPRAEPSPSFTHRTLERLAVKETGRWHARPKRTLGTWLAPLAWVAAMLLALGGGLFAAHHIWPPPLTPELPTRPPTVTQPKASDVEEFIAADPDFARALRYYNHIDDMEMLRQLHRKDHFGNDEP